VYISENKPPNLSKEFFLVRHGKDNEVLSTELNQPLVPELLFQIDNLALNVKKLFSTKVVLSIIYGPSKRTAQTAQHLSGALLKSGYVVNLDEDTDIREFCQGRFRVEHSFLANGKYAPLEKAWEIFNTKIAEGEIHYKFGDPIVRVDGKPVFPFLQDFFSEYGETQSDFLFRIRSFISKIGVGKRVSNHLRLVITHQAVASRIQREITRDRVQLGYCEGVFVPYPEV